MQPCARGWTTFLQSLKEAARVKALRWKLVCCGPRGEAFRGIQECRQQRGQCGERPAGRCRGSGQRPAPGITCEAGINWDLSFASEDAVHLMVQAMEAWIVADSEALAGYYGQGFRARRLPKANNLEIVLKPTVERSLTEATQHTQKGPYHKIRHASDLLKRIDPDKSKGRCPHCERLFETLDRIVVAA